MRRAPRRRIPRFSRRKVPTLWSTTVFTESAIPTDATLLELVLLQPDADLESLAGVQNRVFKLKRILFNGGIAITPSVTAALQSDIVAIYTVLYTIDAEDADASIITAGGSSILSTERVLFSDVFTSSVRANNTAGSQTPDVLHGFPVRIDARLNVNMRSDDLLILGVQFGSTPSAALTEARISGASRVLCVAP